MRRGGCPRRDPALVMKYPGKALKEIMKLYFQKKKELSKIILESIKEPFVNDQIKYLLGLF